MAYFSPINCVIGYLILGVILSLGSMVKELRHNNDSLTIGEVLTYLMFSPIAPLMFIASFPWPRSIKGLCNITIWRKRP